MKENVVYLLGIVAGLAAAGIICRGKKRGRREADCDELQYQTLAEKVGVPGQTINAIEKGDYNSTIRLCIAICRELDKTLDEIFWEEEEC